MMTPLAKTAQPLNANGYRHLGVVIFVLLTQFFIINVERFSGIRINLFEGITRVIVTRAPVDFDVFYLVAQMIWRGDIQQAYSFATMGPAEEALAGEKVFIP
jgi:hypothetical protein